MGDTFPSARFREAGASHDEVHQLEHEFERSDGTAQSALAGTFASMSTSGLREHLSDLREAGHFATPAVLTGTDYGDANVDGDDDSEPSSPGDGEGADPADDPAPE